MKSRVDPVARTWPRWVSIFAVLACAVLSKNCGGKNNSSSAVPSVETAHSTPTTYFRTSQHVALEVYYEPGAEPFTGSTPAGRNYWSILEENLRAIFAYRSAPPTLAIPKDLSSMTALPDSSRASWTAAEIISLSARHRTGSATATESRFYVYFLNGYFNDGSGPNPNVIGVNITGTPIIAMFKDVIESTGNNPNGMVPKFVEQSTLVHEMGHALGMVNIGLPMAAPHQDTQHGAHTTNPDCVMYWLNEGVSDLQQFVLRFITTNSVVMWGPEVLEDAKAFSR